MRYYLDTEFNGMGGELISLALVNGERELYLAVQNATANPTGWVKNNVLPVVTLPMAVPWMVERDGMGPPIADFLYGVANPIIVADWPDDIAYFCRALVTGPGQMVNIQDIAFELERVDAYPTRLTGAVRHNALWDARALRERIIRGP